MGKQEDKKLRELSPQDELALILKEATRAVEEDLALEDAGWINLSGATGDVITSEDRKVNLKLSRLFALKDPLGKQAIRLWTDYTFGTGMVWSVDENNKKTKETLDSFWNAPANKGVLSARGQRRSSDKLLVDGEVFFAIFLGPTISPVKIRFIDPLEITEIITDSDDIEDVKFYRREWVDAQSQPRTDTYRDWTNIKNEPAKDSSGNTVTKTDDALVYHLTYNTTTQRGNPLLLPALIWMKYNTKFLASRIAIMLSLAKWAWKQKVKGGQAAVNAIKAKTDSQEVAAGSIQVENLGVDTTPIKTETGGQAAYTDGRMIKLMFHSAVGFPEQYFGDISIGNLATAKTVELPVAKMIQSYQKVWNDAYQDIDEIVLAHNNVPPDKWYVDRDFPPITPLDVAEQAKAIVDISGVFPEFTDSSDVKQMALLTLGINDPTEVLEELGKAVESNPSVALKRALQQFRESIKRHYNDMAE